MYADFEGEINMTVNDLKVGITIEFEGKLYQVVEHQHVSRPRLAALIRTKLKNIETGQVIEKNFGPSDVVGDVYMERRDMQFSYEDGGLYYFMDLETYDQVPFEADMVKDVMKYLTDDSVCSVQYAKGKPLAVNPPLFVEMELVECEPAVQGDTSRTAYKPAKTQTGLVVKVPLFVNQGEKIKIDTRTGEYVERVK